MAITLTALAGAIDGTNANSYTTASITPTANTLVLAYVATRIAGTAAAPTLSGNGLTWVQVGTAINGIGDPRITLFRAMGATPSAGVVTIDFAGVTQLNCAWSIFEMPGTDLSGTNGSGAVVQFKAAAAATGTAGAADFDNPFTDPVNNATVSGVIIEAANEAIAHEAGFAEIHELRVAGETASSETMWRVGEDQTPAPTWTSSVPWAQVVAEIAVAGGAATADPYPYVGGGYYPTEG